MHLSEPYKYFVRGDHDAAVLQKEYPPVEEDNLGPEQHIM